jgi:hypothetical protein
MLNGEPVFTKAFIKAQLYKNSGLLTASYSSLLGFVFLGAGLLCLPSDVFFSKLLFKAALLFTGFGIGFIAFKIDFFLHSRKLWKQVKPID